jgi:hypothetical protein
MPLMILATVILLPILPAYLLFKALPSTAIVSGPLQGLNINLGGAFAGYFAVVLLVVASHNILFPAPTPPYQVWEVTGQVTDEKTGNPIEPLSATDVVLVPPPLEPNVAGTFKLKFYSWLGPSGEIEFPRLAVGHAKYDSYNIDLNPGASNGLVVTRNGHTIGINKIPLRLTSQEYQPSNAQLRQVPYGTEISTPPQEAH